MLFNSNVKLLLGLVLAVVLVYMLNSKDEISNAGEVEGLDEDQEEELETTVENAQDAVTATEQVAEERVEEVTTNVDAELSDGDMIDSVLRENVQPKATVKKELSELAFLMSAMTQNENNPPAPVVNVKPALATKTKVVEDEENNNVNVATVYKK